MSEITMDQLRALLKQYIRDNYKTQSAFAVSMKCSDAYVSAVLTGKSGMPLAWAELVGAKITMKVSLEQKIEDWQKRSQRLPFQPAPIENTGGTRCMACGKYHYGMTGLPCPTMTPIAYGFAEGVADHE